VTAGGSLSAQLCAENAAPKTVAYSGLRQVFHITVYASSNIKKLRTFKGLHFGRQGFLYFSYGAFGARKLCLHVWVGILSACGAHNAAPNRL